MIEAIQLIPTPIPFLSNGGINQTSMSKLIEEIKKAEVYLLNIKKVCFGKLNSR